MEPKENLFAEAVKNNETLKFFKGENNYFLHDKEYGEHGVLGSWQQYILPHIKEEGTEEFKNAFKDYLLSKLGSRQEVELLIYNLHE